MNQGTLNALESMKTDEGLSQEFGLAPPNRTSLNTEGRELDLCDRYAAWTDNVAQYPVTAEAYYLALGIADEIGEAQGADAFDYNSLKKEYGDVLWYCSRYARKVLDVPFSEAVAASIRLNPFGDAQEQLARSVGIICGVEKKRIRDGEIWSAEKCAEKQAEAYKALVYVLWYVADELGSLNCTLSECIHLNIAKLGVRLDDGKIRGDGDNR